MVFEEPWYDLHQGVVGFQKLVNDYGEYTKDVIGKPRVVLAWSSAGWTKSTLGKVKFNVDVAVMKGG